MVEALEWYELRGGVGVLREVPEGRADRTPRGVDAGEEDEEAGTQHVRLRHWFAIDLFVEEVVDQVVLGVRLVLFDLLKEESEDLLA